MDRKNASKLFAYEHLPPHLRAVSEPIHDMAIDLCDEFEHSAERTLALRKLWEFKNLVVWCAANK